MWGKSALPIAACGDNSDTRFHALPGALTRKREQTAQAGIDKVRIAMHPFAPAVWRSQADLCGICEQGITLGF